MITLTEDLLLDAGGWPVLKEARAMVAAGRVTSAEYKEGVLVGLVKGEVDYRAGLKLVSKTDMENLCGCPTSRRRSQICAHSVAVGLHLLKKPTEGTPTTPTKSPAPNPKPQEPVFPFYLAAAEPEIELHIILPPNLEQAWQRNGLMAVVEYAATATPHLRKPLNTLTAKRTGVDFYDLRFLKAFMKATAGKVAAMVQLDRNAFCSLLEELSGHPRVSCGKAAELHVAEEALQPTLTAKPDGKDNLVLSCHVPPTLLKSPHGLWQLRQGLLRRVAPGLPAAYTSIFDAPVTLPNAALAAFVQTELPRLAAFFEIDGAEHFPAIADLPPPPPPEPIRLEIEGSLNALSAKFTGRKDATRLAQYGFAERKDEFLLKGEREILTFFATGLPALQKEWQVSIGERFEHVTRNVERIEPKLEIKGSGEQWFDLAVDMRTASGDRYTANDLTRLLSSGQSFLKNRTGKITVFDPHLLDDFSNLLEETKPEQRSPGIFRMGNRQSATLASFAKENALQIAATAPWKAGGASPTDVDSLRPIPLGSLEEPMRPYQKLGTYWFHFLASNRFGGILADEMGLGKTVQTLAFLRTQRDTGPSLIVCPASLLFNWAAEAAKWVPELRLLILEGNTRSKHFSRIPDYDLVLTSYPLLRQDADFHRTQRYAAVVLDEAQQIKNPDSQLAQAACGLQAQLRFALTGTPVENSVRDLWSLFHFIMPGYLGSRKDFKERYEAPLSSKPDPSLQQRLYRRISPFILRRTKNVVAKDLPEKLEQVQWCELTPAQAEIYHELAAATRKQLAENAGSKEQKKYRMVMLTALLRLRQAACDVRLLGLESPPEEELASGKLDHLMELVEEATAAGHRMLVFSQFVSMLSHIRQRLEAAGISYCYLDGQSKDRAEQVQKFQTSEVPLFLISLKAGGTGLNLTAADTVIHFDPWWNPAVEAQATDRAHRIGQKKVVTSYKLIARGTVEEKILALQTKKKALIASTLQSEQPLMEGLTLDEIADLLE
jgi:SNF2 family DNA or RNA helicase